MLRKTVIQLCLDFEKIIEIPEEILYCRDIIAAREHTKYKNNNIVYIFQEAMRQHRILDSHIMSVWITVNYVEVIFIGIFTRLNSIK